MRLGQHREAVLLKSLHEPQLPQRSRAVKGLREDPSGEPFELRLAAGGRQRGVPNVKAGVEVRVIHPHRTPLIERHEGEPLAVARHEVQPGDDLLQ